MFRSLLVLVFAMAGAAVSGQDNPLWLRYPAISPDGQTIVFSYKGDLYRVASTGGDAVALTVHEAHDYMPVWSRDGKWLAFASDRFGNFDVFIMPSSGGEARRLTWHSAQDVPYDFSPDNKTVLFGTVRNDLYSSARFPRSNVFMKLYTVPVTGGRSVMVSSAGAEFAKYNSKGDRIIFQDRKGYEDPFRKHHVSAVTRDIWVQDLKKEEYIKVSAFEGEDREPLWSPDDKSIYYLSEKNGSQNIFRSAADGSTMVQLTKLKDHPVRHLTRSSDETLCFTYNGEIWTMKQGTQPVKLNVSIHTDTRGRDEKILPVTTGVTETVLSPTGKEVAMVVRGEIFISSVDGGITKRITNTPQQERSVSFSADGRTLYYAAERRDSWDIYRTSIVRSEEPYFYMSTSITEEPVIATTADEFQPVVSPDGKQIAYIEERTILRVWDLASKKAKTVLPAGNNYSYSDGDQNFVWSPDSKWIAFGSAEKNWPLQDIAIARADGSGDRINVTKSGFVENRARWGFGGRAMLWLTERDGKKPLARQGEREMDVYISFFDQAAYDRFLLTKEELALDKEMAARNKDDVKKDSSRKMTAKWEPDFNGIESRRLRLTINSGNISDYVLTDDGEKLFFLAKMEKGYDLWQTNPRTKETKLLAKIDGGPGRMDLTADGKSLVVASDNKLMKVDAESGKVSPVPVAAELVLKASDERAYIFEHAWRQVVKKFYQPSRLGDSWKMYHDAYARFLPYINNNYDFQELLSELLGELNASHTGGRYAIVSLTSDVTPSLGLLYDETYAGPGIKVMEVLDEGPFYKASTKIRPGVLIEKINNNPVDAQDDWAALLNRQAGKYVSLSLFDPKTGQRWDETGKPISQADEQALLYKRWVNNNRKKVEELSGGKVGYVHVQGMNDASYRVVYEEALGRNISKAALIVDTRFNGGGNLHDELSDFLNGKAYFQLVPHEEKLNTVIPAFKWTKPSIVIMSESNYSDAHLFPYAYKAKNVGKLLGMPVAGTGTSVWWETQIDPTLVFGIPMVGYVGKENRPLENLQLEPDIRVENDYRSVLQGHDPQLERAVKEMLGTVK